MKSFVPKDERLLHASRYLALFPSGYIIGKDNRRKIAEATIRSFDKKVENIPVASIKAKRKELDANIVEGAEQEVKGFLDFILLAVGSFLIQKLLEWLWDNYASEVTAQSRKQNAGASVDT